MTIVRCRYEGGLRNRALHEASGAELITDAPLDNHGQGASFSPTDLVGTALVSCILTIMGIVAERHGIALEGAEARVEKRMSSAGERRIEALEVWIRLPPELEERQRALLIRAGESCPVKRSLDGCVPMTLHWD
jgi:putative redox protein